MQYIEVAPVRLVRKDAHAFTYTHTENLLPGTTVIIPVGKSTAVGVVLTEVKKPSFECRQIDSIVDSTPIPTQLLQLAQWVAEYYSIHLSAALSLLVPLGVNKKRRARNEPPTPSPVREVSERTPTAAQQRAISQITEGSSTTQLLYGVTGSGKTFVYLESAKKLFDRGLSSIILVPEIALTSQIVDEFRAQFGSDVILTHSQHTEAERHALWLEALHAKTPKVVIGPRSALFLPLKSIGLIVLDEFHEPSYKQEQQPRYSGLRVATMLARYHQARAVFGSATPPVAEYYTALQSGAPILQLEHTAKKSVRPVVQVVDLKKRTNFLKHRFLSDALLTNIDQTLADGKQVLIFHNRRGTTSTTLCADCGWMAIDPDSDLPLTLHADQHQLISHISGLKMPVPTSCPECGGVDIMHKGIGTKLLESELQKRYPNKLLARFDGDTHKDKSVEKRYKELYDGTIDIIIGTQVIAKGIDLPHLRTVGVVQADAGLTLPDYTASERTFQLLAQVVGRVGRSDHATTVVVQSYQPEHPAIIAGVAQDYKSFYESTLTERQRALFPPFCYLARFMCSYKTEATAIKNSRALLASLKQAAGKDVTFFGPAPAFYERQGGSYRWHIIAKSPSRTQLAQLVSHLPASHWQFELDPLNLL
jgi:primosomal protein N' (replication factor Y)